MVAALLLVVTWVAWGGGGVEAVSCDQLTQNNKGVGRQRRGEAS